ncbi:hypothetical protein HHE03_09220 [Helicobacter heilmannii]|uniref:Uncharacterized protein n=1 Tax=Helicobacter heilmannii TaxID=35817 RepID=A0A0K2XKM7_HELHE|nr:hypothetical protein [Helicobacter heilmannii]CCM11092.1 hypothetical protein BN341_10480 [Helicobacter heilmannii ASB1.4]CRF46154.1 hypothetical protein HHE014_11460 [Helicobacter heilmannii]CRF49315.1 hypothetical protein HHE03_09220 [Helicobacter heilmannii]CRI34604.1 hypothetical protein HHE01_04050 [Helicobacter heilmannii]
MGVLAARGVFADNVFLKSLCFVGLVCQDFYKFTIHPGGFGSFKAQEL